jgi:hypothetical protein
MKKSLPIIALLGIASAVQIDREPLLTWKPKVKKNAYPVDYPVPNFGLDKDIRDTLSNLKITEKRMKRKMGYVPKKLRPKSHPKDYFVPNFGLDKDIKDSLSNMLKAEARLGKWDYKDVQVEDDVEAPTEESLAQVDREPLLTWKPKVKKNAYPVDYFVPNFGLDKDVRDTLSNLKITEKRMKRKMGYVPKKQRPKSHPKDYFVPNFGLDKDIKDSLSNMLKAEARLGKWDYKDVQLESDVKVQDDAKEEIQSEEQALAQLDREPLLTWRPKQKKGDYPVDYFVPNFGIDKDIVDAQKHISDAEKRLKHKWVPKQDEEDKWIVPKEEAVFKLEPDY